MFLHAWWQRRQERRLLRLLAIAAETFAARTGPIWSTKYSSGEEIAQFVRECVKSIRAGTCDQGRKLELMTIFAPTCDWDDIVGDVELGNQVYSSLTCLYRADVPGKSK